MDQSSFSSSPNSGELDCLCVLWQAAVDGVEALKLSQIHQKIGERRLKYGESPPALTTVSTYLRSAVSKGLLQEVRVLPSGNVLQSPKAHIRGALPGTRSPQTAYQAPHSPGDVFTQTFKAIAETYPADQRTQAVVDFAVALGLSEETIAAMKKALKATTKGTNRKRKSQ